MTWLQLLGSNPLWFGLAAFPLGLIVGSFLNVVIHRLPIMMRREWNAQCRELLEPEAQHPQPEKFNLASPPSHCPQCKTPIKFHRNIPVLSYLLLKGKCPDCNAAIPLRYPVVELLAGVATLVVAAHFGVGITALFAMVLTWALLALTVIDIDEMLLPDSITQPLLWLGLLLSLGHWFTTPTNGIIGAAMGYLALWSVYVVFKLVTGKEGMGHGDFKLLAMLGAWLGWHALPGVILLSSVVGVILGVGAMLLSPDRRGKPIPFGPYLAIAGWIFLLWGENMQSLYLGTLR